MRIFKINGTEYNAKPFDFNTVCDLEEMGVSMEEMNKKHMSVIRAYFALCANKSNEDAGKELEQHVVAGGSFNELGEILNEELEKSDFFRSLAKNAEEEVAENTKEQSKEE